MFKSCLKPFYKLCLINYNLTSLSFYFFLTVFNYSLFKLFINQLSTLFFSYFNQSMSRLCTLSTGINNNNKLNILYYL